MSTFMLDMVLLTALIDIFVWAPSFAMFAKFETCTGGGFISRQPRDVLLILLKELDDYWLVYNHYLPE